MAGQVWSGGFTSGTLGGYLSIEKLSAEIRYQAQPIFKFRQFVNIHEALGRGAGDTIFFDKVGNLATAGGTLVETNTIPETQYLLRKGTLVVTEYGNSVPWTGKLEELAKFDVENITSRTLRDDQAKVLDSAAGVQFRAGYQKYVCLTGSTGTLTTNSTAGGTAGVTGACNLNAYHIRQLVKHLKKTNVPKYDGENYICIASVEALDGILADTSALGFVEAAKYGDPERLFNGEIGKWGGVRFVEETNFLRNTLGSNSNAGEAVIFGADAVVEAIALPEEVRIKIPTDYGRSKGCAWYGILGFKIMWDYSADSGEEHMIHITDVTV
jgi:N4-gp56 family major capsid protein